MQKTKRNHCIKDGFRHDWYSRHNKHLHVDLFTMNIRIQGPVGKEERQITNNKLLNTRFIQEMAQLDTPILGMCTTKWFGTSTFRSNGYLIYKLINAERSKRYSVVFIKKKEVSNCVVVN